MKTNKIILIFLAAALSCACSKDNDSVEVETPVEDILAVNPRPMDWTVDKSMWDPSFSMTLTVEVSLPEFPEFVVDKEDMMAAFMCDKCRSVQSPVIIDNRALFFLNVIGMTTDNPDEEKFVTLKYYSTRLQHIFTAQSTIRFENGARMGTTSSPYAPEW